MTVCMPTSADERPGQIFEEFPDDSLSAECVEMSAYKTRGAEADDWCESLAADGPDAAR